MVTSILLLLLPSIQSFSLPIWSQKRLQYPSFQMATYDVEAWKNGYESCKKEFCEVISNTIPVNIVGTYFRNGHGKFEVGKESVAHPFDADGMITAITINNSLAVFRNRFVGTKGYLKERRMKGFSSRGAFGTIKSGGFLSSFLDLKFKNVANTNVIYWGKQLLALWEAGLPHKLEADSLRTKGGTYTLKGILKSSQTFSAHPKIDSNTNRLVTFATTPGAKGCTITPMEFNEDFQLLQERSFDISGFGFFHDFCVTKNYYIFNQASVELDSVPVALGLKSPIESLKFRKDQASRIYLVPRDVTRSIEVIEVDSHFNFHYANAFEEADGSVVLDAFRSDEMLIGLPQDQGEKSLRSWLNLDYAATVPYPLLTRYSLTPPKAEGKPWSYSKRILSQSCLDFPSINPLFVCKKHRFVYASAGSDLTKSSPFQGLVKVDIEQGKETSWFPEPHQFLGEPCFVNKQRNSEDVCDEDDGYILTFLNDGRLKSTEFVIFDAKNISQGPISRSAISSYIPFAIHGSFAPNLVFDKENIIRRFTASLALDSKNWNEMTGGFSGLGLSYDMQ